MWPNTTKPAVGAAMAETVARVNGEPSPVDGEGTELARLQAQVAHYKALANGDGAEFDKLTARVDELSRENRDLRREKENPKVEYSREGDIEVIPLTAIIRDAGTQSRALLDEKTVERYMADLAAGDKFPPLRGVQTGEGIVLRDGFHRFEAMFRLGWKDCRVDVIQGSLSDAIWLSLSANKEHDKVGLARSNSDKRRAVERALNHPNAAQLSDREIARHVGVTHPFVSKLRKELSGNDYQIDDADTVQPAPSMTAPAAPAFPAPNLPAPRLVTRNGTTYPMNTGAIGSKPSAAPRTQYRNDEFSQQSPDDVPMVDEDADYGDLPPYDETPELPPAVAKQPSPLAPLPQGEGNGWPRPMSEGNGIPRPLPAPVPQVEQASEAERAAALAARQALMTAQPNTALDAVGERDYWPDVMTLRQALIEIRAQVSFAMMATETKQQIFQVINSALSATDHR